jgi:hypothetical protein
MSTVAFAEGVSMICLACPKPVKYKSISVAQQWNKYQVRFFGSFVHVAVRFGILLTGEVLCNNLLLGQGLKKLSTCQLTDKLKTNIR